MSDPNWGGDLSDWGWGEDGQRRGQVGLSRNGSHLDIWFKDDAGKAHRLSVVESTVAKLLAEEVPYRVILPATADRTTVPVKLGPDPVLANLEFLEGYLREWHSHAASSAERQVVGEEEQERFRVLDKQMTSILNRVYSCESMLSALSGPPHNPSGVGLEGIRAITRGTLNQVASLTTLVQAVLDQVNALETHLEQLADKVAEAKKP